MRLAVFASGRGSNMLAIADSIKDGRLTGVSLSLLVCDHPGAPVLEHAKRLELNSFNFDARHFAGKPAYESIILKQLEHYRIDLVVLAGYMRIVGPTLLEFWEGKMINIHPSILPAFPGRDGIDEAFRAGVTQTGVTVHFVDSGVDTGPIIAQRTVKIDSEDSKASLTEKIHRVEHLLLPETISRIANEGLDQVRRQTRMG